jgi:hypothetical protein
MSHHLHPARAETLCRMSSALDDVDNLDDMVARFSAYILAGIDDDTICDLDDDARRVQCIYREKILPLQASNRLGRRA